VNIKETINTINRMQADGIIDPIDSCPAWPHGPLAPIRAPISQRHPMTFDLARIIEGKRALRRHLAARPIAEKLRMLDALRERTLSIRAATVAGQVDVGAVREEPGTCRTKGA
jgi:hypothetical protein